MAFDPFKRGLCLQGITLLHFPEYVLNKISVFHSLASRRLPAILPPVHKPGCDTVNGVSTVGNDDDVPIFRNCIEGAQDCCQLCPLIGLAGTWQGFREISAPVWSETLKTVEYGHQSYL